MPSRRKSTKLQRCVLKTLRDTGFKLVLTAGVTQSGEIEIVAATSSSEDECYANTLLSRFIKSVWGDDVELVQVDGINVVKGNRYAH